MAAAAAAAFRMDLSSPIYGDPHRTILAKRRSAVVRCSSRPTVTKTTSTLDPSPICKSLKTFAPATVANLGPGFDFLGCAVDGLGDHVTLSVDASVEPGSVSISSISGAPRLSLDPRLNCAGIAADAAMRMLGIRSVGLSIALEKGLPLGSGLGSSAASAAAAVVAVNELFGGPLSPMELVLASLESEKKVSGYHADNVAPSILGGFVLIRSYDPLDIRRLEFPISTRGDGDGDDLIFVLVTPEFEAPTKEMRAALPPAVSMKDHVCNSGQAAALVAAVLLGDAKLLGSAMSSDRIVEPRRALLIPGMAAVKAAALRAGAFGCTISGAGPTVIAVADGEGKGKEIGERMVEAFAAGGELKATAKVARLDSVGARVICKT